MRDKNKKNNPSLRDIFGKILLFCILLVPKCLYSIHLVVILPYAFVEACVIQSICCQKIRTPSFSICCRKKSLKLLCLRTKSTWVPSSSSRYSCAPQTFIIEQGISTKTSTSLPSCCSPRATDPNMRKEVIPNFCLKSCICSCSNAMYCDVVFIVFVLAVQRYEVLFKKANLWLKI